MSKVPISDDQLRHLAQLAGVRLDHSEVARMSGEFRAILDYMTVLQSPVLDDDVSISPVQPLALREDEPVEGAETESAVGLGVHAQPQGLLLPFCEWIERGH